MLHLNCRIHLCLPRKTIIPEASHTGFKRSALYQHYSKQYKMPTKRRRKRLKKHAAPCCQQKETQVHIQVSTSQSIPLTKIHDFKSNISPRMVIHDPCVITYAYILINRKISLYILIELAEKRTK